MYTCLHTLSNTDNQSSGQLSFSVEEEMCFSIGYEEGYDLYDEKYEAWLKIHHPEDVSKSSNESTPATPTSMTPLARSISYVPSPSMSSHMTYDQSPSVTSKLPTTPAVTMPKAPGTTTHKAPRNPL